MAHEINGEDGIALQVFDLFVRTLEGERDALDDQLELKLKWFAEDVARAMERIKEDRRVAPAVVLGLSSTMQQLDHDSGMSQVAHETVQTARKTALGLDNTTIHN